MQNHPIDEHSIEEETSETAILNSWRINAKPWRQLIQGEGIASRKAVTNAAILAAIEAVASQDTRALDVGCGEGWLVREMAKRGIHALGIDAIPDLIHSAQQMSAAQNLAASHFEVMRYADMQRLKGHFDVVVCNFSLFGDASVEEALKNIARHLAPGGVCLIQTLHPHSHQPGEAYRSGWYPGSWKGFGAAFSSPAPWYFRTLSDWIEAFQNQGLYVHQMHEPLHPETQQPASVIFSLRQHAR